MSDFKPYSKSKQLARGKRRYRRFVASPAQWQRIIAAKLGPCRVCNDPAHNGRYHGRVTFHHVVPRDRGGDDVPDNLVPLCPACHDAVERRGTVQVGAPKRKRLAAVELVVSLTDAEYAYAVGKLGEQVWESVYGIRYQRA